MRVVELSLEDYEKKYKQLLSCIRVEPRLDPTMTEDERLMEIQRALNPPLPTHIDWYEKEGFVRYILKGM